MYSIKRKPVATKQEDTEAWVAACDELESLLNNVKTALDLVALVQPSHRCSSRQDGGQEQAKADRTEFGLWSSAAHATELHDGRFMDVQYRLPLSIVPPLHCVRASIAASSVYSLPDTCALENARLTEPFSPDLVPAGFWTDSNEEGSQLPNELVSTPELRASVTTSISSSPQSTPRTPASLIIPDPSPILEEFSRQVRAAFYPAETNMFFGDSQKNSPAAHRRRSMATTSALTEYEADLTSKDRIKQKDAIKRILASKVRNDWEWKWSKDEDYWAKTPIVSRSQEDLSLPQDWAERDDWTSNASESEQEDEPNAKTPTDMDDPICKDPFRFDSPDGVADLVQKTAEDRRTRRRRKLHEEMTINDGLRCFTHRRNAWTGARHVRNPRRTISTSDSLSSSLARTASKSTSNVPSAARTQVEDFLDSITEIPIASPILPPETPMRKGVTERAYSTIYDKVILQSQTPFCPINLGVVTKSCVEGWKRDGEWPPKAGEIDSVIAGVKKVGLQNSELGRSSEGGVRSLPGSSVQRRESEGGPTKNKSVLRRSIQKVMGAVRERAVSKGSKDGEAIFAP